MSAPTLAFRKEMKFAYDVAQPVSARVRRIVARNPSAFTYHGTNTYIVGRGTVAIIDPGPDLPDHVDAIARAVEGETVSHIVVTHTHLDHSGAVAGLKAKVGGKVVGAHPKPMPAGEAPSEAIDPGFAPDVLLGDGATVAGEGWTLNAIFTPGHMSNHHCFALVEENTLFSGDHVMGWNSTIVAPPDGNMREYFASLDRCAKREDAAYWPGHGPEIPNPQSYVRALTAHRRLREDEIAACLKDGVTTIPQMVARMYRHLPQAMHGAAARAVFAHVEHMVEIGRVLSDGPVTPQARYRLPG
jgi:glyoxylase-like metal-dependent hydrolase (beta-lactamase superfamily II)